MVHVKRSVKVAPVIAIGFCLIAFGGQPPQTAPTAQAAKSPAASTSPVSEREQQMKALVGRLMQENLNLKMQLAESVHKQYQLSEQIKTLNSKSVPSGWIGHEFNGSEFYMLPVVSHGSGQ